MPREWYINEALTSYRRMKAVLTDMTEEEVVAALRLERSAGRRRTIIDALTTRAEQLHVANFHATLERKIHGTH